MTKKYVVISYSVLCMVAFATVLGGCSGVSSNGQGGAVTPTVDYIERLDVYSAPHKDSFLNQLAMNYRSYATYNARTSGYPDIGELFAQKAVAAFSGETPFPENLENWPVSNDQVSYELYTGYNDLVEQLRNDASYTHPELAAEAQAKFDCWLSATSSGQISTADQCRSRFYKAIAALRDCTGGRIVKGQATSESGMPVTVTDNVNPDGTIVTNVVRGGVVTTKTVSADGQLVREVKRPATDSYYPDTRALSTMRSTTSPRDGVIIVNNVNIPEHLIQKEPVQPMVFNQNIYGGDKHMSNSMNKNISKTESIADNRAINNSGNRAATITGGDDSCCGGESCSDGECDCETCAEQSCGCDCPQGGTCDCGNNSECPNKEPKKDSETINIVLHQDKDKADNSDVLTRSEFVNTMAEMREELKNQGKDECPCAGEQECPCTNPETVNVMLRNNNDGLLTREEFVNTMAEMREELKNQGKDECPCAGEQECPCTNPETVNVMLRNNNDGLLTREEFVEMMLAMRDELNAINARLDKIQNARKSVPTEEKTLIKVQQIPIEPQQHIMEEVFEVRFDFDKAIIKPEYKDIIEKLAQTTQENKNIKVSVIGHTDTTGSASYNYALGGRRADAVQKMLIQNGVPANQIVAVSAGEEDLAVPTGDGVANEANRRVQVIKETPVITEEPTGAPVSVEVIGTTVADSDCGADVCEGEN